MITDEANGEENFGESAGRSSVIGISVFITIGTEKFGELYTICQIRQNFPLQYFPTYVWYLPSMLFMAWQ